MVYSRIRGYATGLGLTPSQLVRSYAPRSSSHSAVIGARLGYKYADWLSDGYMSGKWSYKKVTGVRSGNMGRAGSAKQYVGSAPDHAEVVRRVMLPPTTFGRVRVHKGHIYAK